MRTTDNEVLEYLLSDPNTPTATDLLSFAHYAQEKRVWLQTFRVERGTEPTPADIETWISNWTDFQFQKLKNQSKDFFDESARVYLADDMKAAKDAVRNELIITEVKAAGSVPRQFLIGLITAIVAPLIIAAVLLFGAYEKFIPSPSDLVPRPSASPSAEAPAQVR